MPKRPRIHKPHPNSQPPKRAKTVARGYGSRWRTFRAAYLIKNPLCRTCEKDGKIVVATEVDHIISILRAPGLRWDERNLQPLCKPCHSRKTALEDGGFARGAV